MTKSVQLALAAGCGILVGAAAGAFVGIFLGATQTMFAEGAPRALILQNDLAALRRGKTAEVINLMEQRLDGEILQHRAFMEHGHPWILYPWRTADDFKNYDAYMQRIARYRKAYPRAGLDLGRDNANSAALRAIEDSLGDAVQRVLDQYAK